MDQINVQPFPAASLGKISMEAQVKTVREILHSGDQFLVPLFQRQYSWTKTQWNDLYADVVALIEGDDDAKHFLGPLVRAPFNHIPGDGPRYQLIDGQQRLTTLSLALAALRDVARSKGHDDLAEEIHEDYLIHKRRQDLQRFKVILRFEDRHKYALVIDGNAPGSVAGEDIIGCYSFFKRAWRNPVADHGEPIARRILDALTARLSVVSITVDGENPYEIFASLNGTGLELEESDLIRNFIFMQVPLADQTNFHEAHWRTYENRFEKVGLYKKVPPTLFYRNYLMREGRYCANKAAYVEFKRRNLERGLTPVAQLTELQRFATFELWLQRPELCERTYLRERLTEIQRLDVSTAHPLLLNLLDRHEKGSLNRDELDECLRDLASFVIRRTICGESTRPYGRWFPEAILAISTRPSVDLRRYWHEKGWPDDTAFIPSFAEFPIYLRERKKSRLLLERLERENGPPEAVNTNNLNIEHVLPQAVGDDDSGRSWRSALGSGTWSQEHEKRVHTLGNLTLTGINSELGNNSYAAKQAMFADSNVALNAYFAGINLWNGSEILKRGIALGRRIAHIWPRPNGPDGPVYIPNRPDEGPIFGDPPDPPEEPNTPGPNTHGNLRVIIHWSVLGISAPDESICEPKAGATHAAFLGRLIAEFGQGISEKLQWIPVARRYLLSENPEQDFVNRKTGKAFGYKPVPGTSLSVFTNSSTSEKRDDILALCTSLGLPQGGVEASLNR
jgi:hypothetical protein